MSENRKSTAFVVILVLAGLGGLLFLVCLGIVGFGVYRYQQIIEQEGISYEREFEAENAALNAQANESLTSSLPQVEGSALSLRAERVVRQPDGTCKVLVSGNLAAGDRLTEVVFGEFTLEGAGSCRLEKPTLGASSVDLLFYTPKIAPDVQHATVHITYRIEGQRDGGRFNRSVHEVLEFDIPAAVPK